MVFHVALRNKSDQEIRYRAESFAVRVGNRVYHQSISDAPGVLPPRAAGAIYFAITGTPDSGRNELSLKNDFNVLMSRLPYSPTGSTATATTPPPPPSPSPRTGMTPESEALARQALRRAIAELQQMGGRSALSPSNSPGAKQTPANP